MHAEDDDGDAKHQDAPTGRGRKSKRGSSAKGASSSAETDDEAESGPKYSPLCLEAAKVCTVALTSARVTLPSQKPVSHTTVMFVVVVFLHEGAGVSGHAASTFGISHFPGACVASHAEFV
jgi:hypothetical protein